MFSLGEDSSLEELFGGNLLDKKALVFEEAFFRGKEKGFSRILFNFSGFFGVSFGFLSWPIVVIYSFPVILILLFGFQDSMKFQEKGFPWRVNCFNILMLFYIVRIAFFFAFLFLSFSWSFSVDKICFSIVFVFT